MTEIKAPNVAKGSAPWVFLAGSIDMGSAENWQSRVVEALENFEGIVLNPRRDEWNSSWEQSISNPKFYEQVTWELNHLQSADVIPMYIAKESLSPITLMELGLHANSNKLIVYCDKKFWRRGNVEVICERNGIPLFDEEKHWLSAVMKRIIQCSNY